MMGGERLDISYRNVASTAAPETSCLETSGLCGVARRESNGISRSLLEVHPGPALPRLAKDLHRQGLAPPDRSRDSSTPRASIARPGALGGLPHRQPGASP